MFQNRMYQIGPVAANTTAIVEIPVGPNAPTLDRIQFTLGGTTFTTAHISSVVGKINGREFYREGTGTVHNARRTYLGLAPKTSELILDFAEPNARSAVEQYLSAIPLALCQSLKFEVTIAGATAPTLTALAQFRAPTNNPFIKKVFSIPQQFAAGGKQVVYVPNGPQGSKLVRLWIHEASAGNITAVELRARNGIIYEGTRTEIQSQQSDWGLTPQAGVLVLDMIQDGNLNNWLDTSKLADVQLHLTGSAADTYTMYFEYLDAIGNL